MVLAGLWLLHAHPLPFLIVLGLFVLVMICLLPKLWHGLRWVFKAFFAGAAPAQ